MQSARTEWPGSGSVPSTETRLPGIVGSHRQMSATLPGVVKSRALSALVEKLPRQLLASPDHGANATVRQRYFLVCRTKYPNHPPVVRRSYESLESPIQDHRIYDHRESAQCSIPLAQGLYGSAFSRTRLRFFLASKYSSAKPRASLHCRP